VILENEGAEEPVLTAASLTHHLDAPVVAMGSKPIERDAQFFNRIGQFLSFARVWFGAFHQGEATHDNGPFAFGRASAERIDSMAAAAAGQGQVDSEGVGPVHDVGSLMGTQTGTVATIRPRSTGLKRWRITP
jgi:hypothetical protein